MGGGRPPQGKTPGYTQFCIPEDAKAARREKESSPVLREGRYCRSRGAVLLEEVEENNKQELEASKTVNDGPSQSKLGIRGSWVHQSPVPLWAFIYSVPSATSLANCHESLSLSLVLFPPRPVPAFSPSWFRSSHRDGSALISLQSCWSREQPVDAGSPLKFCFQNQPSAWQRLSFRQLFQCREGGKEWMGIPSLLCQHLRRCYGNSVGEREAVTKWKGWRLFLASKRL